MKPSFLLLRQIFTLAIILYCSTQVLLFAQKSPRQLPYKQQGLSERQAAAYLLDRLAFGARPGDVDTIIRKGLEVWVAEQLQGNQPEPELVKRFADFKSIKMTTKEIATTYPNPGMVLAQAKRDGVDIPLRQADSANRGEYRDKILEYARSKGYRPQREMLGEMYAQKLYRAVYANNQLHEVLTDFWFNHFNVAITDNQARPFVMTYERDAIRPFVVGKFRDMLGATAKHPAMLQYLDNAQSTSPDGTPTTSSLAIDQAKQQGTPARKAAIEQMQARAQRTRDSLANDIPEDVRPRRGINENYARELMELHTLGVDGGYTQKDVTEAARVLTGWTIFPMGPRAERLAERIEQGKAVGFVRQDNFLFRADAHDATAKTVLSANFPAGGGIEEGERLLDMLALHPSTARFISTKLARRFVQDVPPESLIKKMTLVFQQSGGDLQLVMQTMLEAPEFWSACNPKTSGRAKIKSPFELAVSAMRALQADIERPKPVLDWIAKIGQPLYAYQAPTGFPDRAESWINTGSLLNRMNFGLALSLGKIKGLTFNLATINQNREPESADAALETYLTLLLPERNTKETLKLLKPMVAGAVQDPALIEKIQQAATKEPSAGTMQSKEPERSSMRNKQDRFEKIPDTDEMAGAAKPAQAGHKPESMQGAIAQVVGIILGSPEFQRR